MKRDRESQPTTGHYRSLLGSSMGGRMSGRIYGAPSCRVVRSWNASTRGTDGKKFEHLYDVGAGVVCSCDAMADVRKIIDASPAPETVAIKKPCVHVEVLQALGPKFDSTPVVEYGPIAVLETYNGASLSVADGKSRVTVAIDKKAHRYQCLSPACQYYKFTCSHVETVHQTVRDHDLYHTDPFLPKTIAEEDERPPPRRENTRKSSESTHRVTLETLAERVKKRRAPLNAASQWLENGTNCTPDANGACDTCQRPWSESKILLKEANATLYGCSESISVSVFERECHCGRKKQYDGLDDGVFHYSNKTLWLHETMLAYVDLMVEARMPFNAYYKVLERQYERRGASALCSKSTVISSLEAFINLLDVDYEECFTCPICSKLPINQQMYIVDGKAMGFRVDLMKNAEDRERGEPAPVIPGTTFAYIKGDAKAQNLCKLLREYASSRTSLDEVKFNKIIRLAREKAPEVEDVFKYIKRTEREYLKCPQRYRQFLYDIATPCPIACLIPRSLYTWSGGLVESFLERMVDVSILSQEQRTKLMEWGSLSTLIAGWPRIPEEFAPLLKRLCAIARIPEKNYVGDGDTAGSSTPNLKEDEMSFFPNHPRIRKPRVYDGAQDTEQTCTKKVLKSHKFTPGLFSAFCPHGVCIGFEAMRKFESARVPFDLFYTRFAAAPGTIIYDNACNASRYCLRREPLYFSKVLFLIDRLHQCNHSGCHSGYCMNSYPQGTDILGGTMKLGQLNSQAAEQAHAKMTLIETQTSFMGQDTFMMYTKLFMALKNKEVLKRM